MKLRFRKNSLRLRLNQREAESLAAGLALEEQIHFPENATMSYVLQPASSATPYASFQNGIIRIGAPQQDLKHWANTDSVGIYFEIPANGMPLKVSIEKDLECLDGPEEEHDPYAYPRSVPTIC